MITRGLEDWDWTTPLELGNADWLFVEDNTFNFTPDGNQYPVNDLQNGGRVVFRNNTVNNGFFQTHDLMRNGYPSGHAYEIYNNTFTTTIWLHKAIELNSGTGVIFNNAINGGWNYGIGLRDYKTAGPKVYNGTVDVKICNGSDPVDQNNPGTTGWRCQYQVGTHGFGRRTVPSHSTSGAIPATAPTAAAAAAIRRRSRMTSIDYAFSNMPTSAHVVSGRDFINNGNTPKPGYTPYAYPHPLQSGTGPNPGPIIPTEAGPSIPSNLRLSAP